MTVFSIIIPVYNVGEYLKPCLESIRCQAGNWECLLIDDGSTDGSGVLCDVIAQEDSRFRVWHQENAGVSSARNRGLDMACGEWVWFVDADDIIHPVALECLSNITNGATADFIYFDYLCGESIAFAETSVPAEIHLEIKTANIPEMSQWRYVFRRMIAKTTRFENYIVGEDLLFSAKLSAEAAQIAYLPVPLYGYVKRNTSVMHSHSFQKTRDSILWQSQMLQFYKNCKIYEHLTPKRWNKFFFGTPCAIMHHQSNERRKLIDVWFAELALLDVSNCSLSIMFLRKIYISGCNAYCWRYFAMWLNALVFAAAKKGFAVLGR